MGNLTKGLINAFNLNNYFSDKINTNFTVEGKKIVGLFASSTNIGEYLRRIGEKIIKRHYLSGTEVAGAFYNLNCFPFVLGANADKEDLGNGIVKVKLADSTDPAVIHNLKINFANEFERAVISKVVARLQKAGITKKEAYEWIKGTVGTGAIGKPYLYCIAFSDEYLDDSETFEMVKEMYIQEFNSRLEACGLKSSDFYEYKDDMLYIKDVSDNVVSNVARYVRGRVALDFRTPGSIESKVENCKNVLSELIYRLTGKYVEGYDYDDFIDENKIKNGHSFALIPLDNQCETLSFNDAKNINRIFNKGIFNHFYCISDIRGKTANPQFANCKEPVYAFSNKQIALLLPIIMRSPIAYNERNGCFEFAVDLTNFKRRGSSRSSSTVTSPFNSPTHAEPPRTPPDQRNRDSGIGVSPLTKDSGSSSGGPRSLFEQPQAQPRQGSEKKQGLYYPVNSAGTSKGSWSSTQLSFPTVSQGVSGPSKGGNLGAAAASGSIPGSSLWSQSGASSSRGAGENMPTGSSSWFPPPSTSSLTTRNDSISSNLGIFADPPEDTENICSMKPEKQQVTDESDRKSSDECSKAKPQKNESPKKHGGGFFCKERPAKLSPFKRCSVERDTISSSRSGPVHYVTEKPLLSKRSASERRATNNPPSGVTSPVTEACIKNKPGATELKDGGFSNRPKIRALVESSSGLNLQPLTSSQKDELYKVLSPEMKEKLDFGFFPPGYKKLLYLLFVNKMELHLLLSSSREVEQVCSILPLEEKKQLYQNLSLEARKGLLFKFFGDEQEISRNVSTSSGDSGISIPSRLSSSSQRSTNSASSNFSNTSVFFNENFQDENVQIKTDLSAIKVEQNLQSKNKEIV